MTINTASADEEVHGRDEADARMPGLVVRRHLLPAGLAALAGVALTLVVLPPPMYADSQWVWRAARIWPDIPDDFPVLHHAMRLGTVLPTRVSLEILGVGQAAWVAAAAAFAALFTLGIYAVGRIFFGGLVGFIAVGLVVIHPFFTLVDPYIEAVANSTGGLLPDMPAAGLFSIGVAVLVVGSRREGRRQLAWLAIAGLCFGLAYLTREFVALMFVVIPIFFALLRIPQRRLVVVATPMLAVLILELIHNAIVYDDPFARLTVAGEHQGMLPVPLSTREVLLRFAEAMNWHPLGRMLLIALALLVIGAVVTRDRRLVLLIVWFASLWVPFTLFGGLLDPSEPSLRTHLVRYWFLVFPPIIIGAVASLQLLIQRLTSDKRRQLAAAGAVTLLAALAYVAPALVEVRGIDRDEDWQGLRGWLVEHSEVDALYTDDRTAQTAFFYARSAFGDVVWDGRFLTFRQRSSEPLADLVDDGFYLQSPFGARETPDAADGWRLVWQSPNKVLTIWERSTS